MREADERGGEGEGVRLRVSVCLLVPGDPLQVCGRGVHVEVSVQSAHARLSGGRGAGGHGDACGDGDDDRGDGDRCGDGKDGDDVW